MKATEKIALIGNRTSGLEMISHKPMKSDWNSPQWSEDTVGVVREHIPRKQATLVDVLRCGKSFRKVSSRYNAEAFEQWEDTHITGITSSYRSSVYMQ